jgi:hypothetical protein
MNLRALWPGAERAACTDESGSHPGPVVAGSRMKRGISAMPRCWLRLAREQQTPEKVVIEDEAAFAEADDIGMKDRSCPCRARTHR